MADWRKKLTHLFGQSGEKQGRKVKPDAAAIKPNTAADKFLCTVVDSALKDLSEELQKYERKANTFGRSQLSREFEVRFQNRVEFRYIINVYTGSVKTIVHTSYMARYQSGHEQLWEGIIMKGGKQADIANITKDDIISDFLKQYKVQQMPCLC
ncbi:MAG: hypothetical protein GY774_10810 [Planctomycetes bacterium]|nr:hypothetical protein [Planctomycetota bacterium]